MDVVGATKRINGGTIGLDDLKHYSHAIDVLGGDYEEPEVDYNQTIKQGSCGSICSRGTRKLDISLLMVFLVPGTARIVKEWQSPKWFGCRRNSRILKTLGKLLG